MQATKFCPRCEIEKPVSEFIIEKFGLSSCCFKCTDDFRKAQNKHFKKIFGENSLSYRQRVLERKRISRKRERKNLRINLDRRMSSAISNSLRTSKAGRHWETLVGYTKNDLKNHLESKFSSGMTWELFLEGKIHIDHIIPVSFFRYEKPEDQEFQYCWSLDNLQPLWAKDNLSKNNHVLWANWCSIHLTQ